MPYLLTVCFSPLVVSNSLRSHGLESTKLLCSWNSLDKNILTLIFLELLGCHFLRQGIFLTQGLNLGLPHYRQILHHLGFPCGSAGKESTCNGFNPWVGNTPWRRGKLPTPVFWPGEFHGLQSMGSQRVGHDWATFTFTFLYHLSHQGSPDWSNSVNLKLVILQRNRNS